MADDKKTSRKKTKIEQNNPNGDVLLSVKPDLMCGAMHQISFWRPSVIIDSHMHIQSGRCATLPFIWNSAGSFLNVLNRALDMPRGAVEVAGQGYAKLVKFILEPRHMHGKGRAPLDKLTEQQKKSTLKISEDFILARNKVHQKLITEDPVYKNLGHLVLSGVVMTMDMEYAHVDGYYGLKIYNAIYKSKEDYDAGKDPAAYWVPMHGKWKQVTVETGETIDYWVAGNSSRAKDQYHRTDVEAPSLPKPEPGKAAGKILASQTYHVENDYKRFETGAKETITVPGVYYDIRTNKMRQINIDAAPVKTSPDETKKYERWEKQLQYTELAALKNPLSLLPMFHYDPRRYQLDGATGNNYPMSKVEEGGLYIGFKMYTAQGYRPWDPRLPIMQDFYARCCKSKIPIMNHCTPGGASSVERDEFFNFVHENDQHDSPRFAKQKNLSKDKLDYFNTNFVSPNAWRNVLDNKVKGQSLKRLYLCLAHFGGPTPLGKEWSQQIITMITEEVAPKVYKYPNLYTDLSSSFASDDFRIHFKNVIMKAPNWLRLRDQILFGTDWYMTFYYSTTVGKDFMKYCMETKDFLDKLDTSLWPRFTQYNPYRFYRLDEQIGRIAESIIKKRETDKNVKKELKDIKQSDIDKIFKDAAWIKSANKSYEICELTP